MRRLTLATAGITLAIMLAAPRAATAGMGEVIDGIIGLTGPQMIGVPIACEVNIPNKETACYVVGKTVRRAWNTGGFQTFWRSQRLFVSIGGGVYGSTGKNSEMREFEGGRVRMLAFEPMVVYRWFPRTESSFSIEHGAGASALYLFGDFPSFGKGGIKIRPIGGVWRDIKGTEWDFGLTYNLRFFPDAFTAAEFGKPGPPTHGGREFAHGFSVTLWR